METKRGKTIQKSFAVQTALTSFGDSKFEIQI